LGEHLVYTEKVTGSSPVPPILITPLAPGYTSSHAKSHSGKERDMLWLIAGVVLLVIAIAGGVIVHPVLFALGIVALLLFFSGRGTRTV
jgi:hypothetical protein